jgi:hypothetical protein
MVREIRQEDEKTLVRKQLDTKSGNKQKSVQLRLCVDHLLPRLKPVSEPAPINLDLSKGTPMDQTQAVLTAIVAGEISIDDGSQLIQSVATSIKIYEATELEARIAALETYSQRR